MKLTSQRMVGWRTSCLHGLMVILGLVTTAAVASAQEIKPTDEAGTTTKPRDTSKGPNLDVPAKRVADPKMPDISGSWQIGKQGEFGEAVIRRIEDASDDFAWQAPGAKAKEGRDQRLKWSQEAQRFEVTNIDPKPNRSARITLQLLANGKTMRVVYEVNEQAKQELQKKTEFSDSQLNAFLNQEWTRTKKPVGKAEPVEPATKTSSSEFAPAKAVTNPKMPDIVGTWHVEFVSPEIKPSHLPVMEIRRFQYGDTDFLIDVPWVREFTRISVKWSGARQRFEGEHGDDDDDRSKITLQPQADRNSLRVIITNKTPSKSKQSHPAETNSGKTEEYVTQVWTRTSMTFATKFPAKAFGLPEVTEPSESPTGPVMLGSDRSAGGVTQKDVAPQSYALPYTPAAKRLVEQLAAQESAAAAEAATIRQLQANGQAEQNQQPIAEHQRKLKNLLSTAFDLKLQWEELQVQELQSRLSRLERQIGQRKELREKIINRRAGELIEGDALRWDSTVTTPTKRPGPAVGDNKKRATPAVVAILRERVDLILSDMRIGNAKPDAVLRAINELAQAEPPEAHARHVELLQVLLELTRRHVGTDTGSFSKAELLEIEAAYEKARSSDGTRIKSEADKSSSASLPEPDQIVIDLYGGSQVLPRLSEHSKYSVLIKTLNGITRVTTNIREVQAADATAIVLAIVRDPSQRCLRASQRTQKESEVKFAINSALREAGIQSVRWDEGIEQLDLDKKAGSGITKKNQTAAETPK